MSPGISVSPVASITWAPDGACILEPMAAILPSVTTTLALEIIFSPSNTRALRKTKDDALV